MPDVTYSWSITSLCCICSRIFDSVRIVSVAQRWGFYHLYCQYLHIVFIWLYTKCFFYLSLPLHLIVSVSGCSIHYFLFWSAKLVKLIRENHPVYIYIVCWTISFFKFASFAAVLWICYSWFKYHKSDQILLQYNFDVWERNSFVVPVSCIGYYIGNLRL